MKYGYRNMKAIASYFEGDFEYPYVMFLGFPIQGRLIIMPDTITCLECDADTITIEPKRYGSFIVPNVVEIPEELAEEYHMEINGSFADNYYRMECYTGHRRHNLTREQEIYFKNLVRCINNFVVRKKCAEF